jgi:nucleoside-diphosphate-sugar epimerase
MQRVFLIGGSGYIGSAVLGRLHAAGLQITALSRTADSDTRLTEQGAEPVRGDTSNLDVLKREAERADAVIYVAINNPSEHAALSAVASSLEGTRKCFIFTSGATLVAEPTEGHYSALQVGEEDQFTPPAGSVRLSSEVIVQSSARRGVRSMTIRPPLVYGHGGSTQITRYAACGKKTGIVRYVGPGDNFWGYIHVDDLAECYLRLLQLGQPGQAYHAVAGEVRMGDLAGAVGQALNLPTGSWSVAEAEDAYGVWGARVGMSSSCRPIAPIAEAHLKWRPARVDILEDVVHGSYFQGWMA